jgi:hypothetical protein
LPITQTDLADATGLTGVHVNRTLRELRSRSVVTARSGTVTIHNWSELVAIGDFNDTFMLVDAPLPSHICSGVMHDRSLSKTTSQGSMAGLSILTATSDR